MGAAALELPNAAVMMNAPETLYSRTTRADGTPLYFDGYTLVSRASAGFLSPIDAKSVASRSPAVETSPVVRWAIDAPIAADNIVDALADTVVCIQKIREVFRFSVTEIARWVGVSRPTVYAWRDGKTVPESEEHRVRLRELGRYAELFEQHDIQSPQAILQARFFDGKSSMDLMKDGTMSEQHIAQLAAHEKARREEMARAQESVRNNRINEQWSLHSALPTPVVDSE